MQSDSQQQYSAPLQQSEILPGLYRETATGKTVNVIEVKKHVIIERFTALGNPGDVTVTYRYENKDLLPLPLMESGMIITTLADFSKFGRFVRIG
jgi:hypothetical protein